MREISFPKKFLDSLLKHTNIPYDESIEREIKLTISEYNYIRDFIKKSFMEIMNLE